MKHIIAVIVLLALLLAVLRLFPSVRQPDMTYSRDNRPRMYNCGCFLETEQAQGNSFGSFDCAAPQEVKS